MIADKVWENLLSYVRHKIESSIDPTLVFVEPEGLKDSLNLPHKGFYIGIMNSSSEDILREGYLKEGLHNVFESTHTTIGNICKQLKNENIAVSQIQTGKIFLTVVSDVIYIQNPTHWDENKDGVYFQWGQNYKALYLPYQIKHMDLSKIEIMDRLCGWEAGLASNLWRKSSGLVFRMLALTYPEV